MTKAEYYITKMDEQITQAIRCYQAGDIEGTVVHKNIADGFQIKLEKLNLIECRMEKK